MRPAARGHTAVDERRERRGGGALRHGLLALEQEQHRVRDLLLGHRDDVVDPAPHDLERAHAGTLDRDAVGDGDRRRHEDRLAALDAPHHRRHGGGLHADHLDLGAQRLHRGGDAGDHAAASDRDDHHVEVGHLLEQLETDRALPGDHMVVVERVNEGEAALGLDLAGVRVRRIEVVAVEDHLGAQLARVGDLDERRPFGHHDDARDAQPRGMERNRLCVIAGRGRDGAARALLGAQREEAIEGPALLEGARHLQVLELEVGHRARAAREVLGAGTWGPVDRVADAGARGANVVDADHDLGSRNECERCPACRER